MNSMMKKCLALVLTVSLLSSCASNTNNENTAVGAGTGAVAGGLLGSIAKGAGRGTIIGAGIVVGALIGGYIGHMMDSTDTTQANQAMDGKTYKSTDWKNEKTGMSYNVTPTSERVTYNGNTNCRKYNAIATTEGQRQTVEGIACQNSDGNWESVRG